MANGSPMIEPTRRRGFSEPYGSWKIICISRRNGRSARRGSRVMSVPSKTTRPRSGRSSRAMQRASVDLPQPGLPDQAERLAPADLEAHAVDRVHRPARAGRGCRCRIGKCLTTSLPRSSDVGGCRRHAASSLAAPAAPSASGSAPARSCGAALRSAAASTADRWPRRPSRRPAAALGDPAAVHDVAAARVRTRSPAAASIRLGGWPGIGVSARRRAPAATGDATASRPRVYGWCGR